jgi:hypothetical protein
MPLRRPLTFRSSHVTTMHVEQGPLSGTCLSPLSGGPAVANLQPISAYHRTDMVP